MVPGPDSDYYAGVEGDPNAGFSPEKVIERHLGAKSSGASMTQARAAQLLGNWKLTPATLMAHLDASWIPAKWLQYLSLKIAQCVARGNCGLLISAPPRHGKSQLSTIATPLWVLENFPHKNVVVSTYGEELSTDFSRQIRDLIQQNQHILNVRLRQDARRVTNILTTEGGGLKAVGLRGAITGRGADVFVLDDYIKEPKEAMSPQYLEDLYTWYLTVARTRLEPGAVVIILATRWVANDLHGRIMKRQKETGRSFFEYVELPAIAHENEVCPLGRAPGEVLFPERYNRDSIYDIRTELGSRWFNAMFQQRPQSEEDAVLDTAWFKPISKDDFADIYKKKLALPSAGKMKWGRFWDLASTKEAGDYTSGTLALWDPATDEFYIRHIARGQWSSYRVENEFAKFAGSDNAMARRDHLTYRTGIEKEPGSSGEYTINHFQGILKKPEVGLGHVKVIPHPATSSKLLNAQPLLAAAEAGKVFLVADYDEEGAVTGWAKDFLAELEFFPEGEYDDQVDSTSQAYKTLTGRNLVKPTFGREGGTQKAGVVGASGGDPEQSREHIAKSPVRVTFGRRLARTG